jgi:antitoxin (DNA-binding transcriptional repressor) of toxin-antitoxin stability system
MIETTATGLARGVRDYLDKVQRGETVQIHRNGKAIARLVPDSGFMPASKAADLFRSYKATKLDREAADAVAKNIQALDREQDHALAH